MSVRDRRRLRDLCRDVEACLDASGTVAMIEEVLTCGGRPRQLSVRTFLVGMMLAVRNGWAPHIEKARHALSELPTDVKERLGFLRDDGSEVTYKQMADMFDRIARAFDTSPISTAPASPTTKRPSVLTCWLSSPTGCWLPPSPPMSPTTAPSP